MSIRIAVNGFGRIGRLLTREAVARNEVELVAINSPGDIKTSAHLIKYDSVHGVYPGTVSTKEGNIIVNGQTIRYFSERNPRNLPWGKLDVDIVIESTGKFRAREEAELHLQSGARKVIITAPGKGGLDFTVVMGVNHEGYQVDKHHIVSSASCTTNCLAPVARVLSEEFGIIKGLMTTIHSYTQDQRILDGSHKDLRRARAASMSIVPTTTGAASALGLVLPELQGKLDGMAIRVPTPNVSLIDLTVETDLPLTAELVNHKLHTASESYLKGVLKYTEEPLVSTDYIGSRHSAIVDGLLTKTIGDRMVKVIAWYDNEWGYALRVIDLAVYMGEQFAKLYQVS
jgi:glyceraldehyde 3-phosphate dehydrogenase